MDDRCLPQVGEHWVNPLPDEEVGTRKKRHVSRVFFFLTGLWLVLPLGQWLPSKPWPEKSTFLYILYIYTKKYILYTIIY